MISLKQFYKHSIFLIWLFFWLLIGPAQAQEENWVRAQYVPDGDTIILEDGSLVRYLGMDAPEIDHENNSAEPYGFVSRSFNENLVLFSRLRLEFDQSKNDRFGRKLAYVFTEKGIFVNQAIIERGYAFYLYKSSNRKYQDILLKTQQQAMVSQKGIWKNLSQKPASYIGNKNSKRFHLPDCPFGKKSHPKNRVLFSSSRDAFWQGFSPCRQCLSLGDLYDP